MYIHNHEHVYETACYYLQGSYGRLGLGNSDTQSSLKSVDTFPEQTQIRRIASSKGADGHTLAVNAHGAVFSWGDGESILLMYMYADNCNYDSLHAG